MEGLRVATAHACTAALVCTCARAAVLVRCLLLMRHCCGAVSLSCCVALLLCRCPALAVPAARNDLLFSLHALALSLAGAAQAAVYTRAPDQRVHGGTWAAVALLAAGGGALAGRLHLVGEGAPPLTWLDASYACGFVKVGVTLIKYIPQVRVACACVRLRARACLLGARRACACAT